VLHFQEWHCTLRGPPGTEFEGGLYHFRILLPAEYPFRPPSILMLTPNGRFELNTKICISFTNYHEELWQPAWGVRTAILGLQGFFPLKGQAAVGVGSIDCPTSERKRLAALSRNWVCSHCQQPNISLLPDPSESSLAASKLTPQLHHSSVTNVTAKTIRQTQNVDRTDMPVTTDSSRTGSGADVGTVTSTQGGARLPDHQDIPSRKGNKPPALLDAAISILFVLLFAIVCRRMV